MDEIKSLFCVDILVTLAIFPTKSVLRYALYNGEGFVQVCLFLVFGTKVLDSACLIEGILPLLRCVLCVSSEILSLD